MKSEKNFLLGGWWYFPPFFSQGGENIEMFSVLYILPPSHIFSSFSTFHIFIREYTPLHLRYANHNVIKKFSGSWIMAYLPCRRGVSTSFQKPEQILLGTGTSSIFSITINKWYVPLYESYIKNVDKRYFKFVTEWISKYDINLRWRWISFTLNSLKPSIQAH